MTKFRRAHEKQAVRSSGMLVRVLLFGLFLGGIFWGLKVMFERTPLWTEETLPEKIPTDSQERFYLPTSQSATVIHHKYYSLAYAEKHEQAEWVAYELRRDRLKPPWVGRTEDFRPDAAISTKSALPLDYRNSGFDKGHLVPAGDMAFDETAMSETFLMSNISPQVRGFNHGIWRELEELTRDWAKKFGHLYVVTGPHFEQPTEKIGQSKVSVPKAYFKVLLDMTEPEIKAVSFLIPNRMSVETLDKFAMPIDSLEFLTGLDFFPDLLEESLEIQLEKTMDLKLWPMNAKKYQVRIERWNRE